MRPKVDVTLDESDRHDHPLNGARALVHHALCEAIAAKFGLYAVRVGMTEEIAEVGGSVLWLQLRRPIAEIRAAIDGE